MAQLTCPRCRQPIQPGWRLCPNCGQTLQIPQVQPPRGSFVERNKLYLMFGALFGLAVCLVMLVQSATAPSRQASIANFTPAIATSVPVANTAIPVATATASTAAAYAFKPTDFLVTIDPDTNIAPGNWAALRVKVTNKAPAATKSMHIVLGKEIFDSYELKSVEPSVIADHMEQDGRHFDFPGLKFEESVAYTFNMIAKEKRLSTWHVSVYYDSTKKINDYTQTSGLAIAFPTAVPTSTRPPVATATPGKPAPTAAEIAYMNEVSSIAKDYSTSINNFSTLMERASRTPALLQSDSWRIDLVVELVTWKTLHEQLNKLTPPPSLREIHTTFQSAATHFDNAADLIVKGLDNNDTKLLNQAISEMELGNADIRKTTALINAWNAEHGAP